LRFVLFSRQNSHIAGDDRKKYYTIAYFNRGHEYALRTIVPLWRAPVRISISAIRTPRGGGRGGTADWYSCRHEITRVAVVRAVNCECRRAALHSAWRPTLRRTASSRRSRTLLLFSSSLLLFSSSLSSFLSSSFCGRGNDGLVIAAGAAANRRRHRHHCDCSVPAVVGDVAAVGRRHRVRVYMQIRAVLPRTVLLRWRQVLWQRVQPLVLVVSETHVPLIIFAPMPPNVLSTLFSTVYVNVVVSL